MRELAVAKRAQKHAKRMEAALHVAEEKNRVYEAGADGFDLSEEPSVQPEEDGEKLTDNSPETRVEIYRELAQQKKEKEDRATANLPRVRDYEAEQAQAVAEVRAKEEQSGERDVKQKNEGHWDFTWDEESKPGYVVLDVSLPRHLDSSLVDVDVHPNYVSMIVKSKTLRLKTPVEVKSAETKCQRSKTTGSLMIIMPKVNPRETLSLAPKNAQRQQKAPPSEPASNSRTRSKLDAGKKKLSLQEQMMAAAAAEAAEAKAAPQRLDGPAAGMPLPDYKNIVRQKVEEEDDSNLSSSSNVKVPDRRLVQIIS